MTKPKTGRPKKISHEQVIAAARRLGISGLTVKAVADELGVSVQALYYYVKDADDLRDQVAEHLMEPFGLERSGAAPWEEWAYRFAHRLRDFYESNPGLAQHARSRVPQTRSMLLQYNESIEAAMRSGFRQTEAEWATRAVVEFVSAWVARAELRATAAEKNAVQFRAKVRAHADLVPTFARALEASYQIPALARFDFTLRAMLSGLSRASLLAAEAGRSGPEPLISAGQKT